MIEEQVILVDEKDQPIGEMGKLAAHQLGKLHRAFSILIFNSEGELLLQQRASHKYHSPSLWTNACCSHPRPGEPMENALSRRLMEELGIECKLKYALSFQYHIPFDNGLIENELDHVYMGTTNRTPDFNLDEVMAIKYVNLNWLKSDMAINPNDYTYWFRLIMDKIAEND